MEGMNVTTTIGATTTITNVVIELPSEQLSSMSEVLKQIQVALAEKSFLDSQLFGAIVGAGSAILVFLLELAWNAWRNRSRVISSLCSAFVSQMTFFSPDALISEADMHMFAGKTTYSDGTVEETPEKARGEKMVIMLKRKANHRQLPPFSKLKRLFRRYEKAIAHMPDGKRSELKNNEHYLKAKALYQRIENYLYKNTGENEYTA